MNPTTIVQAITMSGGLLGVDKRGHLVVDNLPPALAALVESHRADLALAVLGERKVSGWTMEGNPTSARSHRWRSCTDCRRSKLTAEAGGVCALTVGCKGKTTNPRPAPLGRDPILAPVANLLALLGPQSARQARALALLRCCRPGCDAVAEHLTATLEPLCRPDFVHLAQAQEQTPQ